MSSGSASEDWLERLMGVRAPWRVIRASAPEGDAEGFVEIEVGHGGGPLACPECGKSAKRLDISWDQASAVQSRAVERGLGRRRARTPKRIGVDETSFRKRHRYVTVVSDLDSGAVLGVAPGRTKAALDGILAEFDDDARMGVEVAAMDMHDPYVRSVRENTLAAVAFDKFHVAQGLSRGIDQVRRREHRTHGAEAAALKRTRFPWLRTSQSLGDEQRLRLDGLRRQFDQLERAWGIKEWAMSLWTGDDRAEIESRWREWLSRAQRNRLKPMVKVARTVRRRLQGIVTAVCTGITNARAEGVNAKIQWIKRMAHGCRNMQRFMKAILFHLGQLDLRPHAHAIPH